MDKERLKRALAGVCIAGLLTSISVSTTGCSKEEEEKQETQTEESVEKDTTKSACSGGGSSCSG
jgi:radical SAM modification target selenobiotic family peptide